MILLADSGSTKCDWLLTDSAGKYYDSYKTIGFNPFFHSSEVIAEEIKKNESLFGIASRVEEVYYYGAGNSSEYYNDIVRMALTSVFKNARLHVDHDLLGAAYATYDGKPCISCILGTGSNSCYFDGKKIYEQVPALGYILGDEASGSYFGKQLLSSYLYKKLPPEVAADLEQEYGINKATIFEHVYERPNANVYLASFTRFISKYRDIPLFTEMLHKGMVHFIKEHVLCYEDAQKVPVHFVGSIAFHFQEALQSAAKECGVKLGNITKQPIQNLLNYHVKYIFPTLEHEHH